MEPTCGCSSAVPFAAWLARPTFRRARVVTTVSPVARGDHPARESVSRSVTTRSSRCRWSTADRPVERPGPAEWWSSGRLTAQKRVHLGARGDGDRARRKAMPAATDDRRRWSGAARRSSAGPSNSASPMRYVLSGAVAPADVPSISATAACCLMPAKGEGFGLAAAEALMQGVPVVACLDGGGLCDIVPGPRRRPARPATADAIAAAVIGRAAATTARDGLNRGDSMARTPVRGFRRTTVPHLVPASAPCVRPAGGLRRRSPVPR